MVAIIIGLVGLSSVLIVLIVGAAIHLLGCMRQEMPVIGNQGQQR